MTLRRAFIIILSVISFSCFSCGHESFFDEEEFTNISDSILNKGEDPFDNNTSKGDTNGTDSTSSNTNQTQTYTDSYHIDTLFTGDIANDTLVYVSGFSKYMNQTSSGGSMQGAAAYGDYLFQFQDHNAAVFVYNLANKSFVKKITLTPNSNNHCNQASFSNIFYHKTDKFPLLYVSGSRTGTYNHIQVYRITDESDSLNIKQTQEIVLPPKTKDNYISWTCIILDNNKSYLYAYSNATSKLIKFNIPDYQARTVNLKNDDILEIISIANIPHQQGGTIRNGVFYMIYGVPSWGDRVWLRVFNLATKTEIVRYNLSEKKFKGEPESIFFYNNELYAITNNAGIYKITLKKSVLKTQ